MLYLSHTTWYKNKKKYYECKCFTDISISSVAYSPQACAQIQVHSRLPHPLLPHSLLPYSLLPHSNSPTRPHMHAMNTTGKRLEARTPPQSTLRGPGSTRPTRQSVGILVNHRVLWLKLHSAAGSVVSGHNELGGVVALKDR
ncbi:jg5139 [Pararge aegeria aegeria]|uniref:Jg5139 protein n=1 Tax=Pararge aegeria aegeria TaxID=348720 RepID=A0A8S4S061_9NEOP|nr:jg5139 [Pararge aegeria aegeria]